MAGRLAALMAVAMVSIGAFNALARYLGRYSGESLSSNAYIELQWYLFSGVFMFGSAWTLRENGHVRVDVLYGRLSRQAQRAIDLAGTLLFLLPFCIFTIAVSWQTVERSFAIAEQSPDPGGLPRYPIKALIPIAFGLLFLQGISQAMKLTIELVTGRALDPASEGSER